MARLHHHAAARRDAGRDTCRDPGCRSLLPLLTGTSLLTWKKIKLDISGPLGLPPTARLPKVGSKLDLPAGRVPRRQRGAQHSRKVHAGHMARACVRAI